MNDHYRSFRTFKAQRAARQPSSTESPYLAPRLSMPNTALVIMAAHLALVLYSFAMYATGESEWGFALTGAACSAIVAAPFLDKRVGFLSMWGVLWLVVLVGAGIRGVMISTRFPEPEIIDSLFLLGRSFDDMQLPALICTVGVGLLTAGYYSTVHRSLNARAGGEVRVRELGPDVRVLGPTIVYGVVGVYAAVGAVSTLRYYNAVGGFGARISERRTVYTGEAGYESFGVEQFFAGAGVVALMLFLAYRLQSRGRLGIGGWIFGIVLVVNAFAINVVTTVRADILFVSLGVLLVIYTVKKRVSVLAIFAGALSILLAIAALSADRGGREVGQGNIFAFGIESGLLNRNAFDLSKTLQIIAAVPDVLSYQKGATIYGYILAPVPRSIWPDKPVVSPGPIIGDSVYGLLNTGVPPGLIAELVWNFGIVIALALIPVVGVGLALVECWALSFSRFDIVFLLVYASVILPFGHSVIGVSVGQSFSASLQSGVLLVPLALVLMWAARQGRTHRLEQPGDLRDREVCP